MHVLDDPHHSARVRALLTRARRYPAMDPTLIEEHAHAIDADAREVPPSAEAVEAMVRFEERYGGLWYPVIGGNGMERGLDGEPLVADGAFGWAIPCGIVDGDHTWPVDVLLDGRTVMTLANHPRVINRSVAQRLETHAQLVHVRSWPHVTLRTTTERDADPQVTGLDIAAPDTDATGPADRWWGADGLAIHLELHTWWTDRDDWQVRCFARREHDLSTVVDAARQAISGAVREDDWCYVCGHRRQNGAPCLPSAGRNPL